MEQLILVVHVLAALGIIALILLQQGKGAEAGASFGAGGSQTVFGSSGGGNFFTRATAVFATVFFVTSFGLAITAKNKADIESGVDIPTLIETSAQQSDIPAVSSEPSSDIPAVSSDDVSDVPADDIPQP
jgi:preprotein translocase subunit SecG